MPSYYRGLTEAGELNTAMRGEDLEWSSYWVGATAEMKREGQGASVLLVDDDDDMLQELADLLTVSGYTIHTANNPIYAYNLVKRHRDLDVILMDEIMPGTRGTELYRKMRADIPHLNARVILMTGFADIDLCVSALRLGFHDFIQKPVQLPEITRSLERAARNHQPTGSLSDEKMTNAAIRLLSRMPLSGADGANWSLDSDKMSILAVSYDYDKRQEKLLTKSISIVTGIPLSSTIRHIDELCDLGLTERLPDTSDGRRTLISITPSGKSLFKSMTMSLRDVLA